jgi:hypothetical protein
MPVINLGPFGRFEITQKGPTSIPVLPTCGSTRVQPTHVSAAFAAQNSDKPPPYSAVAISHNPVMSVRTTEPPLRAPRAIQAPQISPRPQNCTDSLENPWRNPGQAKKPTCRVEQLKRYLVELIALNLDADFDDLNAALYDDECIVHTNSILSSEERVVLLGLSRLVETAQQQVERKMPMDARDKMHLQRKIIRPSYNMRWPVLEGFALDLIAWYCTPRSFSTPHEQTIPAYWAQEDACSGLNATPKYARESLENFQTVISQLPLTSATATVLEKALDECCVRVQVRKVDLRKRGTFWPLRPGFWELRGILDVKMSYYKPECGKYHKGEWMECVCLTEDIESRRARELHSTVDGGVQKR